MKVTKEERTRLIEQWKESGKSKWAFSKELGINGQTFNNWTKTEASAAPFIEIKTSPEGLRSLVDTEIRTGNEMIIEKGVIKIHLPKGVTRSDLALVIQVLG